MGKAEAEQNTTEIILRNGCLTWQKQTPLAGHYRDRYKEELLWHGDSLYTLRGPVEPVTNFIDQKLWEGQPKNIQADFKHLSKVSSSDFSLQDIQRLDDLFNQHDFSEINRAIKLLATVSKQVFSFLQINPGGVETLKAILQSSDKGKINQEGKPEIVVVNVISKENIRKVKIVLPTENDFLRGLLETTSYRQGQPLTLTALGWRKNWQQAPEASIQNYFQALTLNQILPVIEMESQVHDQTVDKIKKQLWRERQALNNFSLEVMQNSLADKSGSLLEYYKQYLQSRSEFGLPIDSVFKNWLRIPDPN